MSPLLGAMLTLLVRMQLDPLADKPARGRPNPNNRFLIRFRLKGLSAIAYEERKFLKRALFSFRARDPQSLATVIHPPGRSGREGKRRESALPQLVGGASRTTYHAASRRASAAPFLESVPPLTPPYSVPQVFAVVPFPSLVQYLDRSSTTFAEFIDNLAYASLRIMRSGLAHCHGASFRLSPCFGWSRCGRALAHARRA
jgi:hypothetical protein